jgi:hypothetical protein
MSSRGVPPPSDGSYARLVGGVAVRLDRRSELTAVVYGRGGEEEEIRWVIIRTAVHIHS